MLINFVIVKNEFIWVFWKSGGEKNGKKFF